VECEDLRMYRRTRSRGHRLRSLQSLQLSLDLRMPWNGHSPRGLTRGSRVVSFVRKGMGRSILPRDPVTNLELFPEGTSYGT